MRIIGYIQHPAMKVTVFKMDNRISVKFEIGLYEQTYKFRISEGLETIADVQRLVDQDFMKKVMDLFEPMHKLKQGGMERHFENLEEDFDEII